jgi:HAD superfamily hydrolase (TIGR01450 family)
MASLPRVALADGFDGLLIDLDGVVWVGRDPVPGSPEALAALLESGKELVFVTNNPGRLPEVYAQRLEAIGVAVEPDRILTAGVVTARLAAERVGAGGRALVVGAAAFKEAAEAAGLALVDGDRAGEAEAVLVASHAGFDYDELLAATRALRGEAPLFATSRDPTLPMPDGPWPGTGAVLAAVETASGRVAEIGGKPEPRLFQAARERIAAAGRVAMVGDRIASDILGASRAGLETVLVLSGASSRDEAEAAEEPPDHVVEDLAALLA